MSERKGCDAFLAYILDSRVLEKKFEQMLTICEFTDIFLVELSGLPPKRKVEFVIELMLWTTPILIAPCRMAPTKLKVKSSLARTN
ncbi:RVP_2 domain-containing protein [Gossypium australe]|uniref:RVP_2 domain-containing protein n=1 Tax=Gossypium australe TaxID=47621 RepID=A0A5B6VCJ5_9ROSI|nr:RVP_2 domain-containing protein [Gossypium australe]